MGCGYGRPRRNSSLFVLRSTSACMTGRNVPLLSVTDKELPDLASPDALSDQLEAKGFPGYRRSAGGRQAGTGWIFPTKVSCSYTLRVKPRHPHTGSGGVTLIPDRAGSGGPEDTPPALPIVLTTPFFVDPLETSSAQTEGDSPTLCRRTGQEPPSTSRNKTSNLEAAATTVPGKCVPISRPALGAPAGQLARRIPHTKCGPSCYLGGGKPSSAQAHVPATAGVFDATRECWTLVVLFFWQHHCSSQWTHSRFTINGTSFFCAEQHLATETSRFFGNHLRFAISCVCPTPSCTSHPDARYAFSMPSCGNTTKKV